MPTINVVQTVTEGNTSIGQNKNFSPEHIVKIEEEFADASSDVERLLAIDVSALKVFSMIATQAMTIKTNNSGTPQETFTLAADEMKLFQEGDTAIFAGDVTKIFVTNSSGSAGTLSIIVGTTP